MVLIGVDPHKATHTAVAVDATEAPIATLTVQADRRQVQQLLAWAEPLGPDRIRDSASQARDSGMTPRLQSSYAPSSRVI